MAKGKLLFRTFAVYRHLFRQLKVGVGYSFVDFNDDLTRLDDRNQGWFVNFVGKF